MVIDSENNSLIKILGLLFRQKNCFQESKNYAVLKSLVKEVDANTF